MSRLTPRRGDTRPTAARPRVRPALAVTSRSGATELDADAWATNYVRALLALEGIDAPLPEANNCAS